MTSFRKYIKEFIAHEDGIETFEALILAAVAAGTVAVVYSIISNLQARTENGAGIIKQYRIPHDKGLSKKSL